MYTNKVIFFEKYRIIIVFGLLLFATLLLFLSLNNHFWLDGDNVNYSLLAKDMLSKHFRSLQEITQPPHLIYWPGFPAMLAIPTFLFGSNIATLKIIPIISLLIALFFIFKFFEYKYGTKWGIIVLFLMTINPTIYTFGHSILTQSPFLMTLIISIYLSEIFVNENKNILSKEFIFLILISVLSRYIRPEGYFLALFIFIYLLLRKKYKPAILFALSFTLLCSIWIIRNIYAYKNASALQKEYLLGGTRQAMVILQKGPFQEEYVTAKELVLRFFTGFKVYSSEIIPKNVLGMNFLSERLLFGIFFIILVAIGYFRSLKIKKISMLISEILKTFGPEHIYVLFGFTIIFLSTGRSDKYLYPLIPFIIFYFLYSIDWILHYKKIKNFRLPLIISVILILGIFSGLSTLGKLINERKKTNYYNPTFSNYIKLAKYLKLNYPKGTKFITRKPPFFYWYSGFESAKILYKKNPLDNIKFINAFSFDYLLYTETGFDYGSNPFINIMLQTYPQFFTKIESGYSDQMRRTGKYIIYKIEKNKLENYLKVLNNSNLSE